MKSIYNYHPQTGEFINEALAEESPLEPGILLVPAFATTTQPPSAAAHLTPIFTEGQWQMSADWRGAPLFSTTDGSAISISEIGMVPADAGATELPSPSPAHSWHNGTWSIDAVKVAAALTAAKTNALDHIAVFSKSKRTLISGTADDGEIAGWSNKLRIAEKIVAKTATDGDKAAFQREISNRGIVGETFERFVGKVLNNAVFYSQAVGVIDGQKRQAQDSVNAARTPEAVEVALETMKTQFEAEFQSLMALRAVGTPATPSLKPAVVEANYVARQAIAAAVAIRDIALQDAGQDATAIDAANAAYATAADAAEAARATAIAAAETEAAA